MQDSWNAVQRLIEELKPLLLESGVPERQVTMPEADPTWIVVTKYDDIFTWLHELKLSPEYEAAVRAWKLVKPEVWQGYKDHGFTGLQEQNILQAALAKLRKRWKLNRPSFFGRKFRDPASQDETSEQDTGSEDSA